MVKTRYKVAGFLLISIFFTSVLISTEAVSSTDLGHITRDSTGPLPPRNLSVVSLSSELIEVTWDPPESDGGLPLTEYHLYRSVDEGPFQLFEVLDASGTDLLYWDISIEPDRNFSYRISAVNSIGESDLSGERWTITYSPPNPPTNLFFVPGDGKVFLNWTAPVPRRYSDIDGYRVRVLFEGEWTEPSAARPGNSTSWDILGFSNGKEYTIRLFAFNIHGESDSAEITFRPGRPPDPPSNVRIQFGDGKAEITWSAPGNNGGYPVTRYLVIRQVEDAPAETVAAKDPDDLSYIDHGLEDGAHYRYHIRAENELGLSEKSTVVTAFTPITYTVPQAPTIHRTFTGQLFIRIEWKPPREQEGAPVLEYVVYRTHLDNGRFENITRVDGTTTYQNDTEIEFDINYTYRVSAVNRIGESRKSNSVTLRVRNASEPPPPNGTVREKKDSRALILGIIAGIVIVGVAASIYFMMTYRGRIEPPPDVEAEVTPEELIRGTGSFGTPRSKRELPGRDLPPDRYLPP
ncbi:MAG: fibronectin type III domain-containing protein [Thermoplasmatota archaeon]